MEKQNNEVKEKKISLIRLLICFAVSLVIYACVFLLIWFTRTHDTLQLVYRYLSDTFIFTFVFIICIFGLSISSREGVFDGLSYSGRMILGQFIPMIQTFSKNEGGYKAYKEYKEGKRKKVIYEFLIVALLYLIIGLIFYALFYTC